MITICLATENSDKIFIMNSILIYVALALQVIAAVDSEQYLECKTRMDPKGLSQIKRQTFVHNGEEFKGFSKLAHDNIKATENNEFKNLKRKWSTLANESSTSHVSLPEEWFQPAKWNNLTFNSTSYNNELTLKILALIQKNQNHEKFQRVSQLKGKQIQIKRLTQNPIRKTFDLKEKLQNITRMVNTNTNSSADDDGYYPKGNKTVRSKLYQEWQTYYECLQENVHFRPQVHYAFRGETVRLQCRACLRPGGQTKIIWKMATPRTKSMEEIIENQEKRSAFHGNRRLVVGDKGLSLSIFAINERDAGNYSCSQSKTLLTVHFVQVAEETENMTRVWPSSFQRKPHSTPDITLPNFGLTVFTNWKNWSECSRCGRVGKRFRIGVCTVKLANTTHNAPKVLTIFKEGIPCCSGLLPKSVREHPNIITRKSEIMEAFCKVPCPQIEKFVLHNEKGQIVEEADNAKGIYSTLQKLPKLPPPVQRKIIFLEQWDTAHIQCPGSVLADVPTRWFVNKQPIYAKGDRIYVTPSHNLIVEDLGLSDSNLYSCWQGSRLVGTVRLSVSQPIRLSYSQQISFITMILILLTFILILGRAFCNSLKSTN